MSTLYLSDLDGTLFGLDGKLSDESARILGGAVARGCLFSVATARSPVTAVPLLRALPLKLPAVLMNGVLLTHLDTSENVSVETIPADIAARVCELFTAADREPFVYTLRDGHPAVEYRRLYNRHDQEFCAMRKDRYRYFDKVEQFDLSSPVIYINVVDTHDRLAPIFDALQSVAGIGSTLYEDNYCAGRFFLEVFSAAATKENGMRKLKGYTGASRVFAFGDNVNDIGMLRAADDSAAVANAYEEAKAARALRHRSKQ